MPDPFLILKLTAAALTAPRADLLRLGVARDPMKCPDLISSGSRPVPVSGRSKILVCSPSAKR